MSTIPPGTSLDRAAQQRVEALAQLFRDAVAELARLEAEMRRSTFRRSYLKARIAEAQRVIDKLMSLREGPMTGSVVEWARVNIPTTYEHGAGLAVRDLRSQLLTVTPGPPMIHVRAVDALINRFLVDTTPIIVKLHANVFRTTRVVLEQGGFGAEIAQGIIGGLPRRTVSKQLTRALRQAAAIALPPGDEPTFTHVDVGNRTMRVDVWAEMHARTELARASTGGTRVLSVANGVRHVQMTSHAHEPCICTPFEGRIYALDQGDPDYMWVGDLPNGGCPLHPNCVHREAPAVLELLEARGELKGRTKVPADFVGLSDTELAALVRASKDQLQPYSMDRSGYLPEDFRVHIPAKEAA